MKIFIIVSVPVLAFLLLFALYVFFTKPGRKRNEMNRYKNLRFAHRGLHGEGRCENSMSAFRAAIDKGYGIELDVRLSSDGELVVFHDDTLDRVTSECGRVDVRSAEELSKIKLGNTDDTVPTFREVLELVDGKVPLLVEIKEAAMKSAVTEKAVEVLSEYKGDFIVESFNPLVLAILRKRMPNVLRGQLSHRYYKEEKYRKPLYFLLQNFILNFKSRPDFLAFCHEDAKMFTFRFLRRVFGVCTLAWTVRSENEEILAYKNGFDGVIFENYEA